MKAAYILRPGKAPGIDGISNEMIICLLESNRVVILKLFNNILLSNTPIIVWNNSLINPIHKKGSKLDPDNYRAISLLCCLGKFFSAILNQRLLKFVLDNNIISKEQLGFMPGNRTSDALIILYNLYNQYCRKNNKYIYACFVDFKKAFDRVPRHILFEKLISHNITGKFYDCIKNMYLNDQAAIKIGDKITDKFEINQGVKQGCIISPLLFNIFLADLPKRLNENKNDPLYLNENENETLSCIVWADDLLLLSETETGLNNMLEDLNLYSYENLLEINLDKTKCMIFNKTGRLIRRTFYLGNKKVDMTREYKYLGFLITPSINLNTSLCDLKDRALRAIAAMKTKLGPLFKKHILISLHLFDSLIKPILLYASDFWGCLKLPKNNPIENVQISFCKEVLGVQKQTHNIGVLLELGRIPLTIFGKKNCVKNWERIALDRKANNITTASYDYNLTNNTGWTRSVKDCISKIGLMSIFSNKTKISPNLIVFLRERDIFHQEAFFQIQNNVSKLQTFALLKTDIGIEKYLTTIQNVPERISHSLMIENGRHQNIEREKRFCSFCPSLVSGEVRNIVTF